MPAKSGATRTRMEYAAVDKYLTELTKEAHLIFEDVRNEAQDIENWLSSLDQELSKKNHSDDTPLLPKTPLQRNRAKHVFTVPDIPHKDDSDSCSQHSRSDSSQSSEDASRLTRPRRTAAKQANMKIKQCQEADEVRKLRRPTNDSMGLMSKHGRKERTKLTSKDAVDPVWRITRAASIRIKQELIDDESSSCPELDNVDTPEHTAQPMTLHSEQQEALPVGQCLRAASGVPVSPCDRAWTDQPGNVDTTQHTAQPNSLHSDKEEPLPSRQCSKDASPVMYAQCEKVPTGQPDILLIKPDLDNCSILCEERALMSLDLFPEQLELRSNIIPLDEQRKVLGVETHITVVDPLQVNSEETLSGKQQTSISKPVQKEPHSEVAITQQIEPQVESLEKVCNEPSTEGMKSTPDSSQVQGAAQVESQSENGAAPIHQEAEVDENLEPRLMVVKKKGRTKRKKSKYQLKVTDNEMELDACQTTITMVNAEKLHRLKKCTVLLSPLRALPQLYHTPPHSPVGLAKWNLPRSPIIFNPYVEESVKHRVALYEEFQQAPQIVQPMRVTRTKTRALAACAAALLAKEETIQRKKARASQARERLENMSQEDASLRDTTLNSNYNVVTHLTTFLKPHKKNTKLNVQEQQSLKRAREMEAQNKKQELIQSKIRELKRQRDERRERVLKKREALDKGTVEQAVRLQKKDERLQLMQHERDEKHREEAARRKMQAQQKATEMEERRNQEETARLAKLREQEEEQNRLLALRKKEQVEADMQYQKRLAEEREAAASREQLQKKLAKLAKGTPSKVVTPKDQACDLKMPALEEAPAVLNTTYVSVPLVSKIDDNGTGSVLNKTYQLAPNNELASYKICDSGDSSDDEKNPKLPIPKWATRNLIIPHLRGQAYVPSKARTLYMSTFKRTPDLVAMFGKMDRRWLNRKSSAVWHTPPHFNMPRF